jgi:hypothetical protein
MQDKFHRFGWFNMFAAPDMTPHDELSLTLKMPAMGCSPQRRFQGTNHIPATNPIRSGRINNPSAVQLKPPVSSLGVSAR